ncbi:MAG: GDP-L-fucose synthase [Novosphingobium sp.]|uniref:GDP-L-fucose synthase family protein n=1 Tax=Novosphingobium sp. TaxID=1874826 RepID=UPI0030174CC4
MRVWITGGGGMVGQNLLLHPSASDHEILAPGSKELDLRDCAAVSAWARANKPDIVLHCAGRVGGIQANMADPVGFLVENLDMGRNVLLAAAEHGVARALNLGSSCMYPRAAVSPLTEDMVLTGELEPTNEGYALAKVMTARLGDYLTRSREGLSYKTLIPCNLYGYFDKFDPAVSHLVPAIIRKIDHARRTGATTVEIWGNGEARREFLFSLDLATAIWACVANFDALPQVMNIGLGTDYTINEFYEMAARVVGWEGAFTHDLSKPVGMARKLVSTSRQEAFGWRPATSLEQGMALTYNYFLENVLPKEELEIL